MPSSNPTTNILLKKRICYFNALNDQWSLFVYSAYKMSKAQVTKLNLWNYEMLVQQLEQNESNSMSTKFKLELFSIKKTTISS